MNIKRLNDYAIIPTTGSEYAAGYDLYAATSTPIILSPSATVLIGTGWAMEVPLGFFGAIFARSGLATKEGLRPANCVGVIDSDYRGEVKVALHNDSTMDRTIEPGERIAQLIVLPYYKTDKFVETDELEETARGVGGFGSTGK